MKDLIIIGGGPAGVSAGVYAARKLLDTVLIAEEWGGQSTVSEGIENWIGTSKISGAELGKQLKAHLEALKGEKLELVNDRVISLEKTDEGYLAKTKAGKEFSARAVLIASGASRRKLEIPGAASLENKGVTYCASCDGPLFAGMDTVVIGGGNAGFETAAQLLAYAKSVTLLDHNPGFKADAITVAKVQADPKMKAIPNAEPVEIKGDPFVTALSYKDKVTGETHELPATGIFVEIGVIPNTQSAEGLVALDRVKRIVTDPKNQRASLEGIWAAGDCTDELYHQNNIAAGDGVKALEDIYLWIKTR